jgi:hypothetical protein
MSADRQAHEISEPNEWDFKCYGWRVVLAACPGVMGGFDSLPSMQNIKSKRELKE